ncbi:ArnT family glycosyltransferase [Hymenobacter lutimineralis]|uniref:ArnT family glycosyltransferase n=1 Tax=Hymenobacter lutimineralis TaxID=2606448 RepID=UPI001655B58F|nr:glycosyltransferase family 39 protein [Hymenobacter lutimineralis]
MNRSFLRLPHFALLGVVLFTTVFFWLAHEGLYALDDYYYARYAHQLLTGAFRVEPDPLGLLHDPLKERPLIFGPVALLYRLFGISIITTTLWPLLATLGCAGLLWALYRRRHPVTAAGAMLLLGLHYFTLNLATYLYPDNILMFWCLASAAALLQGRRPPQTRPAAWGAGFAVLNFAALLSKETIAYYLPFYLLLLGRDVWRRQHLRFWFSALLVGGALLAGLLLFYQHYTHDALYRLHLIENTNAFLSEGNYLSGNRASLVARLTWQPVAFLVGSGLGVAFLLAAWAAVPASSTEQGPNDARYWLALGGCTLAFYWWGSTSLAHYNPISLLPRMTTPLLPPLCLAAGFGLERLVRSGRGAGLLGGLLLGSAAWLHNGVSLLYGGMGLFCLLLTSRQQLRGFSRWLAPGSASLAVGATAVLGALLVVRPAYIMLKPTNSAHFAQQRLIQHHLQGKPGGVVLVDDYLIGNYDFFYDFRVPTTLSYRRYWARDSVQLGPGQHAWLLLNRSILSNDELTRKLIRYSPDSVLSWFPRRRLLAQDGTVELYQVSLSTPAQENRPLEPAQHAQGSAQ